MIDLAKELSEIAKESGCCTPGELAKEVRLALTSEPKNSSLSEDVKKERSRIMARFFNVSWLKL